MITTIAFVCLLSTWAACPPGVTSQLNQVIPTRRRVENAAKLNQESPMEEEERHLQLDFSKPILFHDPDDVPVGASVAKALEVQVSMSMYSIFCMSISPSCMSTDFEGIVFDAVDDVPIESVGAKTTVASSSSKTNKNSSAKSDKRPTTTHSAKVTKGPVAKTSPIETEIVVNEVPIETPTHGTKIDIDQVTPKTKLTQPPHTKSTKAEKVFKSKTAKSV